MLPRIMFCGKVHLGIVPIKRFMDYVQPAPGETLD